MNLISKLYHNLLILHIIRYVLGGLFIFSGILKWMDIPLFYKQLAVYPFLTPVMIKWIASSLPVVEVFLGVGLVIKYQAQWMARTLFFLVMVFTGVIIWALLNDISASCGCFGKDTAPISWWIVLRNLFIMGALLLWWQDKEKNINQKG